MDLKAFFSDAQKHELTVSTYQMAILMLFNLSDRHSFSHIAGETGISSVELKRQLQSLACSKYKILLKQPKSRDVNESDEFHFNSHFTNPQFRLKLPTLVAPRETESESKETREKVEEARKHMIDATIVRVMKSRNRMDHNHLISEVTSQLLSRFPPDPTLIKKRIEVLIDREYLERDIDDRKAYKYMA